MAPQSPHRNVFRKPASRLEGREEVSRESRRYRSRSPPMRDAQELRSFSRPRAVQLNARVKLEGPSVSNKREFCKTEDENDGECHRWTATSRQSRMGLSYSGDDNGVKKEETTKMPRSSTKLSHPYRSVADHKHNALKNEAKEEPVHSPDSPIEDQSPSLSSRTISQRRVRGEDPQNNSTVERSAVDSNQGTSSPEPPKSPEKPNFEASGLLLQETNLKNGVVLKYHEPADAEKSSDRWRLYVFKETDTEKESKILHLHRASYFIVGKDPRVAEILLVHPTISKQHAVIQFRQRRGSVIPYLMDLESTNGTFLNGNRLESSTYYELRNGDSLKFGRSSRDLILLNETESRKKNSTADAPKLSYADWVQKEVARVTSPSGIAEESEDAFKE